MIINRNALDRSFLKNVTFLEETYHLIIVFEYIKNDMIAHCFGTDFSLLEIATIKVGSREDTKERKYINLSRELRRIFA